MEPPKKNRKTKTLEEKNIQRLERKALLEKQKQIKKTAITAHIDPMCLKNPHGSTVLSNLADFKISYEIVTQKIPGTIYWQKELQQTLSSNGELQLTDKYEDQKDIIVLIPGEEVVNLIKIKELHPKIKLVKEIYPNKLITLVVFGLREFCRINKSFVGRKEIELVLTELQLFENVNHRLLETSADFGLLVAQFSKSIAEIPYKKQLNEKYNQEDFYIMNDNRDCVSVQDSNGLSRLWQQHLIKLSLVTLETAEAIMKEYPMPKNLIEVYEHSEKDVGTNLLTNIPVRRAGGGPLSSVRKIGPELSKKMYTLYTTTNPNQMIG